MIVAYEDRSPFSSPHKEFAIDVVHGPMPGRGVVLHVRDQTFEYAQPHLTPTEARQLAADLTRMADACEGKL